MARWDKEEWRLFVACSLFTELRSYENKKCPFTWQRESADMATILEPYSQPAPVTKLRLATN